MADLGIARPQDLLANVLEGFDALHAVVQSQQAGAVRDAPRRRGAAAVRGAAPADEPVDLAALRDKVELLNAEAKDYRLRFEVSDSLGQIVVQIIDEASGEVLRTVPPAAVLRLDDRLGGGSGQLLDAQS